ncbi:retention module-containing protein [Campylobacter concisus]|uniref:retention module-containing protein n=1 Tax=Campylobacter concisus TaxID=199 RepID=UPI001CE3FD77|nr:retention module-containing protein [Campylobacter concisus]MCA6130239.1 retention module-containing protein [Campylobacter concisus]MCA6131919.1 retention module-containing protein [Campylobacter concisus]
MAKEAGVVKSLSGKAVAVDQNGNARELKVGDIVYMGESVKTSDAADKVTIVANNGKELTVLGSDTLSLNPNTIGAEGLADISALQNAILNGGDLTKLEETAAGGNAAAGGGDGVSLGEARFAEGGHYSNINENYRNLTDTNRAFASYDSPIGGYNDGNDGDNGDNGANTNIIPGTPTVKFLYDFDGNHTLSRVEHGNDTDINTSKVLITVPNDGTVRAGDILKVTVTDPNGNETTTNITITPAIITNGYPIDALVEPGKNSKVEASVTNFQGNTGGSSEDHVTPTKSSVSVEFTEDRNNDKFLTYTENNNDSKQNESPVLIKVSDVIPGDKLHITLTKPDGTTENKVVTIDQNIINNGYKITDMPVAEGKVSKVDAYVTDSTNSNTWKSDIATDDVTPDVRPTLTFTEDRDNDGGIDDFENSKDGNFRSTTVEVTLPKDVVVGDKVVITYTDPLTKHDTTKIVPLTQADVDNHMVNTSLPVFPDVWNYASAHVVAADGTPKSVESNKDNVIPIGRNMEIKFIEQDTLHEISRQESMDEHEVNETTALIRLPNKIDNGDIVTLTINEPTNGVYTRNFTINMNDKGEVTSITEVGNGGQNFPLIKESFNQYSFEVPGFDLRNGQDTTIKASIKNMTPGRHTSINEPEVSASLEHVKAPEVIFDEAHNSKTMSRKASAADGDEFNTTATIKIPKNAVDGDRIEVKITEPQLDGTTKDRTLKFNVHKDASGVKITDEHGNDVAVSDNGFKISHVGTLTGAETKISATIIDKDDVQSATGTNSVSVTELDDSGIFFGEDADANTSITRDESMKDHDLHKTDLKIKVPNNVITGDKMILEVKADGNTTLQKEFTITRNGNSITLTDGTNTITADSDNKITVPGIVIGEGKNTEAQATFTDAKDHAKTIVTNHATLENLHDDMTVIFKEDADFNGILNRAEANSDGVLDKTTATIKLPSNVVDGDILKITTSIENGTPTTTSHTIHKDAQGNITVDGLNVVGNEAVEYTVPLQEDKTSKVSATVSDATGVDKVKAGSDILLDADGNGGTNFYVLIDEDKDRNGKLSRDEANSDGKVKETSATVSLPSGDLHTGNTFTVKVNGVPTTYKVTSNNSHVLTIEDAAGNNVPLAPGNLLKIPGIAVSVTNPAKVEVEIPNIAPKSAEAILEPIDNNELSVIFNEDNANRNNELSRDEAISDNNLKTTTVSVKVPYNVVTGDHVKVDYVDPNTGTPGSREFKITKTADGKITATDIINGGTPQDITKTNTIQVDNVPMKPGEKTKVDATITTQDDQTAHADAEAKLAQLSSKGLSVSIAADANDNGTITRDETSSNTSKVSVSLPGSVIAGDSIKVEITNAGSTTPVTKEFKVLSKDPLGNIVLENQADHSQITLENGKPLELDAAIAVGQETKAKVTLSDGTTTVSTEDHAKVEMDAIRGMQFSEDGNRDGHLYGNENFGGNNKTQDTTPVKIYVSDDARAGDTVEIKYTDPDNHAQTKTVNHVLTADDMSKGVFDQLLDINARSAYDLKVDATLKTPGGLVNKTHSDTLRIELEDFRMDYDPSKVMKGGEGTSDTIVFRDTSHVDLSGVTDLNTKVESIERIELKGNSEIKFDAKDIFAMTDNINTILKIRGDSTSKVDIKGKWHEDSTVNADFGSKGYTSNDTVNGQTVHIIIEDKIQTDL